MTYKTDPTRWTDTAEDVPDVLRAPFASARREGPNDLQMRALAVKLAALSAGTAAAASAATAKAATAKAAASTTAGGAAAASTGTLSIAKIAVSVALFGATITGAVVYNKATPSRSVESAQVGDAAPSQFVASQEPAAETVRSASGVRAAEPQIQRLSGSSTSPSLAPSVEALPALETLDNLESGRSVEAHDAQARTNDMAPSRSTRTSRGSRVAPRGRSTAAAEAQKLSDTREQTKLATGSVDSAAESTATSEIGLLQRARAVLGSRPRQAFALTQQHREKYPRGMFAQERDALAVEALMRAGEMGTARSLAERFVREYPSSPHAHRFRESMGLR